ncbi:MAG TPA: response regulator [Candidatus Omnitrophota bacterium]|nr:response regulator [Candidatus Omnitrophota bacterium]
MFGKIASLLRIKTAPEKKFKSHCVLIIDDNAGDLLLIQRTVEKMGHRALTAQNGKVGLELAKAEKPDLILSDCRMPEMDGVEMCRRIKEDPQTRDIPLVFLTGVETPSIVVECFDMGVDNYICKPINPKLLMGQIKSIFEEHLNS